MGQDVHSNQCIELKGICEFDADDFVEDERKGGFSALLARSKSDPKRITFDLALALSGFERSLSKRGEAKRLRNRARPPTDGRTGIEQGGCLVAAEISYREGSED